MRIALQDGFLMVVEIRVVVMTASLRWHAADLPASISPVCGGTTRPSGRNRLVYSANLARAD